jgi:hypothetical protein
MTSMEHFAEGKLAEKTEVLGGNLPQYHCVIHKSNMT